MIRLLYRKTNSLGVRTITVFLIKRVSEAVRLCVEEKADTHKREHDRTLFPGKEIPVVSRALTDCF